MSKKTLFKKESVLINFVEDIFRFYNIEVVRLGYNQFEIVIHYGKLGNKGTRNVIPVNDYKKAMAEAYNRYYEKKSMGYINKEDIMVWFKDTAELSKQYKQEDKPKNKKRNNYYQKQNSNKQNDSSKYKCDLCEKLLKPAVYFRINDWARNHGNWDKDKDFIGYKKVLCFDCQFKHDIFEKRF